MTTAAHAIEISERDIEIVESEWLDVNRGRTVACFTVQMHKPLWGGVFFESGRFRKREEAYATKCAILDYLRELGVEVRP